ncbi:hypothetical protein ABWK22_02300 [Gottfriedia acidiceleris]|uniref:hypothetical protein n=1 Tax=Gottfriedia acidiceleris TaxID=371036 RepID=UPI0033976174
MRVGDIIVVSGKSWISKMIQKVVGSKWTHVALYVGGGYVLEIDWNTKASVTKDIYPISGLDYIVLRNKTELTKEQRDSIISSAIKYHQKGTKYDWLLLIGLFFKATFPKCKRMSSLNSKNTFVCTELVDKVLTEVGIDLFPNQGGDIFPHDYLSCEQLRPLKKYKKRN